MKNRFRIGDVVVIMGYAKVCYIDNIYSTKLFS